MNLKLTGKTALVTGSTAGIGYSTAEALAAEGTRVIVNGRTQARVDAALTRLGVANAEGLAADLATAAGAEILFAKYPDLDILVNNLGIFEPKRFEEIPDDEWRRFFEVNVLSGVRLSRYYLPRMKAAGWGRIVFLSSASAVQIPTEMIHYGMSKAALLAVSRGLAETTAGTGVTVNCVLPGPTASEGVVAYMDGMAAAKGTSRSALEAEFFKNVRPSSLLQRLATTEEVAAMVTYVCSPVSAATNGAALRAEGGVVRSIV